MSATDDLIADVCVVGAGYSGLTCTETATRSNGFVDGAIRAGERAAEEVLSAL
jgi:monoamine oxidase